MKILLITDNYTLTGGAEKYFFDLLTRIQKIPNIEVFSLGFGPYPHQNKNEIVFKSLQSNLGKLLFRFIPHPLLLSKLKKLLQQINPDVIHLHNVKQYPATLLRALASYKVVQTVHDYSYICPTGQNIHRDQTVCLSGLRWNCWWKHHTKFSLPTYIALVFAFYALRRRLKKTINHFIAPSPLLVDYLHRNHFQPATHISPFKPEKKPLSFINMKPCHFLFAGALASHKGVDLLLKEFALACQQNPTLRLTIAGKGPQEKTMQNKVQEYGIEKNLRFIGWREHLDCYYDEATALIFPSIWVEAFGLVITESMNQGRPIIGSNRGSVAWLIKDGETGLLFDPLKPGDLAEKILTLANDIEYAKRLGKSAYAQIDTLMDNEKNLEEIINIYQNLGHSPSPDTMQK